MHRHLHVVRDLEGHGIFAPKPENSNDVT
jgi:hypothetical protein